MSGEYDPTLVERMRPRWDAATDQALAATVDSIRDNPAMYGEVIKRAVASIDDPGADVEHKLLCVLAVLGGTACNNVLFNLANDAIREREEGA
jgi:hypothetical protein